MRIAIFIDTFYPHLGGVEDTTALLASSLGARGHQVDIYVPKIPSIEIDLGENVRVHRFPSLRIPIDIPARLAIPSGRGWRLLRQHRPDIIHVHTIMSMGLESLLASKLLKIPLVGTNHSIVSEFSPYAPFAPKLLAYLASHYDSWFFNQGEILTAPSQDVITEMSKHGFSKPSCVISNQIDTETFCPSNEDKELLKESFGLAGRPLVSFAGRFALEKRVPVLLQAIALVRKEIPNVILALAGHGAEEEKWRKLIAKLEIEDNVKFVGTLNKPDLAKLFQASDVFAIASPVEAQSMVTLQAMACATPVVGVRDRALPEYVSDGETGYLVPTDDYEAMAEKIIYLLKNKELAQHLGQAGRKIAEQYSTQAICTKWEEVYQRVIDNYNQGV
ncbi:MAG TPA: glycosyltransferase [Candidatus Paceibacterota bacterium]|nr:glycosyltransferase [Candidatus Paceibacterota bacterium]